MNLRQKRENTSDYVPHFRMTSFMFSPWSFDTTKSISESVSDDIFVNDFSFCHLKFGVPLFIWGEQLLVTADYNLTSGYNLTSVRISSLYNLELVP